MALARAHFAALLLLACGIAAAAKPAFIEKPWKGSGFGSSATTADSVEILFAGNLSHMGRVRAHGEHTFDGNRFAGAAIIESANGHMLEVLYEAVIDFSALPFVFRGTLTVIGGAGNWEGVSGSATLVGIDRGNDVFEFELDGTLRFLLQ